MFISDLSSWSVLGGRFLCNLLIRPAPECQPRPKCNKRRVHFMSALLFKQEALPRFSEVDPQRLPEQIQGVLDKNRQEIVKLLAQPGPFTWENLQQPLENLQ